MTHCVEWLINRVLRGGAFWLALAVVAALPAHAQDERILDYHSEIRIQADASVEVTEHITVRSLQRNIRRGIYRDFPTRYRDRFGNRVKVDFEVIEVLRDGEPEPWFTENVSNGVRVNTGDDSFLPGPGEYTFSIRYRTTRQLGFFDEHDELYWNVTGLDWAFPIDRASAEVHLPEPVPAEQLRLDSYTGPRGATGSHAEASREPGVARFETTKPLRRNEGLTIAVGFPKGIVEEPTPLEQFGWLLYDNRSILVLLLALGGVLVFYIRSWLSKGRGPEAGVIFARYEPPKGYSPAGLRYVMRESYDHRCFTADLIEMGIKGMLTIEREKSSSMFSKDQWSLVRGRNEPGADDPPTQRALHPKLFTDEDRLELKSGNASKVQAAMKAHTKAITDRYAGRYINPNHATLAIGWLTSMASIILAVIMAGGSGVPAIFILTFALLAINFLFTKLMPAPTEEGRRLLDHVEGLKLYLSVAESDDLKTLEHRSEDEPSLTPERFEALLPYALALDVEEAWTGKFTSAVGEAVAEQTRHSMGWYSGSGAAAGGLGAMSSSLGQSLSSTIGSSGGGGGGSSGGGGGGGGGGGR